MNVYITTILAVASPSIAIGYYRSKKKKKKRQNAPEDSYILICVFHLVAVAQERYRAMHPYVYMQWLCNV